MQLGMIGLGRMGANMVRRLLVGGTPVYQYEPDTWGPAEVGRIVSPPGGWQNPVLEG